MANRTGSSIVGIVLVVLGVGLAFWGYRMSGAVGAQISQAVTGSPGDTVMVYYVGGAAAFFVGLFLLFKR